LSSARLLEPCDFSLQGRDALIDCLHGKVVEALSDLVRRRRLSWRRAENLIVISSHCESPHLTAKAGYSERCITPHWNRAMCYSHSCLAFAYSSAVRCKSARETYVSGSHKPQTGLHPPRFGGDKMEQLLLSRSSKKQQPAACIFKRRNKLADALLFESVRAKTFRTLVAYIS